MRRSDFADFQRVLLLLWSRLEFRSRSTLSIHQELDQVKETFVSDMTKNECRAVGTGGAMIDTPISELIESLNQNIVSMVSDLSMVDNGRIENVTIQGRASTSEAVTRPLPHIYPALPPLKPRPCAGTPPAVLTMPTAPIATLPPQPNIFCAPTAPIPSLYSASKTTLLRLNRTSAIVRRTIRF